MTVTYKSWHWSGTGTTKLFFPQYPILNVYFRTLFPYPISLLFQFSFYTVSVPSLPTLCDHTAEVSQSVQYCTTNTRLDIEDNYVSSTKMAGHFYRQLIEANFDFVIPDRTLYRSTSLCYILYVCILTSLGVFLLGFSNCRENMKAMK